MFPVDSSYVFLAQPSRRSIDGCDGQMWLTTSSRLIEVGIVRSLPSPHVVYCGAFRRFHWRSRRAVQSTRATDRCYGGTVPKTTFITRRRISKKHTKSCVLGLFCHALREKNVVMRRLNVASSSTSSFPQNFFLEFLKPFDTMARTKQVSSCYRIYYCLLIDYSTSHTHLFVLSRPLVNPPEARLPGSNLPPRPLVNLLRPLEVSKSPIGIVPEPWHFVRFVGTKSRPIC
jgi:hypothetical protein